MFYEGDEVMGGTKISVVQEKGQVTIPEDIRRRWGLKEGSLVAIEETEEGILLRPQEAALDVLDRLGKLLADRGIDLEELLASGREIREEIVSELYGTEENGN